MSSQHLPTNDNVLPMGVVLDTLNTAQQEVVAELLRRVLNGGYAAIEHVLHAVDFLQPLVQQTDSDSDGESAAESDDSIVTSTTRQQRRELAETYKKWRCNLCESINVRTCLCTTCGWDSD
ncbi:hypothetical protein VNI00_010188 [Paramarasmius palmivorus]|uniref:RanBP2-type domain-containing protein n=1 Tax=Paramarasmius palmivorus TaxID=297713 RepID=A0AAW0CJD7_9AGAR